MASSPSRLRLAAALLTFTVSGLLLAVTFIGTAGADPPDKTAAAAAAEPAKPQGDDKVVAEAQAPAPKQAAKKKTTYKARVRPNHFLTVKDYGGY